MKAVVSVDEGVVLREVPEPVPGPHEVLVRVHAASLNRADLFAAAARTGKPLGMEWAGEVVRRGADGVLSVGERVICTGMGGFAEYAVAHVGRVMPLPPGADFAQGSVVGLALQTMHDALVSNGRLSAGETVLVHGASTAVGLMALQMARHLGAATVIATSTSADKRAKLAAFGATHVLDANDAGWVAAVLKATGGKGVDLVIDQIAGPRFDDTMRATAVHGRIVNVGRLGGDTGPFNFDLHALRRIQYTGVTFRTRDTDEVRVLNDALLAHLGEAIASGVFQLPVHARFALADAAQALALMASNAHFGKLVLAVR